MQTSTLMTRRVTHWLAGVALLAAATASNALTFSFAASGFGVTASCGSNCIDAFTIGDANDTGTIASSWSQLLNFTVTPSTGLVAGTWSLNDYSASLQNDLSGTFTGLWTQVTPTQTRLTLNYVVTDGGGVFAGFRGTGMSVLLADADFNYTETGSFNVSAVPEPANWALWMAGLTVGAAVVVRRQKPRC